MLHRITAFVIIGVISALSASTQSIETGTPELPRVLLDTSLPSVTGRRIDVPAGGNLQAAVDSAQPGDEIVLQAGAAFVGPVKITGNGKSGSGWITLRGSWVPPVGVRVTPADAVRMPKILSPDSGPALDFFPSFGSFQKAQRWRIIGVEVSTVPGVRLNFGLVKMGATGWQRTVEQSPTDIVLDRCYIHGRDELNLSRGVALNGARQAIIDSYISECHAVGFDSQAICGWNGPGPFKIVNNYLEASGENVLFGGADPTIQGLVPSDIESRGNYCSKPLSWWSRHLGYAGVSWSVKNLFELKNAQRVLIEGNTFENNWVHSQNGYAILFTVRNQDGRAPWSVVQDVTFTNNIVRHTASGINILGQDYNFSSQQVKRIKIANNLFYDVDGTRWGGGHGAFLLMTNSPTQITIDHNTVFQSGHIMLLDSTPNLGIVFTNNLVKRGCCGIFGSGLGEGSRAIAFYLPDVVLTGNYFVGASPALYSNYPDNQFPSSVGADLSQIK